MRIADKGSCRQQSSGDGNSRIYKRLRPDFKQVADRQVQGKFHLPNSSTPQDLEEKPGKRAGNDSKQERDATVFKTKCGETSQT
jgi:hypothetical protein